MKNKLILFSLAFLFILSSFVLAEQTNPSTSQEITVIKTQQNMLQTIDQDARTVTYTFSSLDSAIKIQNDDYWNVASENKESYVMTDDEGNLIEANLTASKETSWTFGNQTLKVPKGVRVFYKNGAISIDGQENKNISLSDKNSGNELNGNLKLGKDDVMIDKNGFIVGRNYEFNDVKIIDGKISIVNGGYLLKDGSLADWRGLTLTNNKNLFLATSFDEVKNYENWIFPEDLRLRGEGDGFEVVFDKENNFAKIESLDTFAIKAEGCEFDLFNRNNLGEIPKLDISGKWKLLEDGKTLFMQDGELQIKKFDEEFYTNKRNSRSALNQYDPNTYSPYAKINKFTSPLEISVLDSPALKNENLLITNFNGFSMIPHGESEVVSKEIIANSIYHKRLSNSLTYNYPDISTFESISGKSLFFDYTYQDIADMDKNPIYEPIMIRNLIDYWSTLPENIQGVVRGIVIYDPKTALKINGPGIGDYDPSTQLISFTNGGSSSEDLDFFNLFRHEVTHNYHDFIGGEKNTLKIYGGDEYAEFNIEADKLSQYDELLAEQGLSFEERDKKHNEYLNNNLRLKYLNEKYGGSISSQSIFAPNSEFTTEWISAAGGIQSYGQLAVYSGGDVSWKENPGNLFLDKEDPRAGFVGAYASFKPEEDVATFAAQVVSDPAFFKRNNLTGSDSNPVYKQKLEVLLKYHAITQQEYDAVMQVAGQK